MRDVRRSAYQTNEPAPINADYRNTPIEEGKKVAFNYQGSIKLGTIVELKRSEWKRMRPGLEGKFHWSLKFELLVQGDGADRVSKLSNPNSFVIID